MAKAILVTTFFSHKEGLMQSYVLPYLKCMPMAKEKGARIYLISLEKKELALSKREKETLKSTLAQHNIYPLFFSYKSNKVLFAFYFMYLTLRLWFLVIQKNITHIHSWCLTSSAFGSVIALLSQKPFVIDSCEPHADSMLKAENWHAHSLRYKIMLFFERFAIKRASTLIYCVPQMNAYIEKHLGIKTHKKEKYVKPACVDLSIFKPQEKDPELIKHFNLSNKTVLIYSGKLGGLYYEKPVFELLNAFNKTLGHSFVCLMLTQYPTDKRKKMLEEHNLNEENIIFNPVAFKDMPRFLSLADIALNPTQPVLGRRYGAPIKNAEYLAMGLPIIIPPNIANDSRLIQTHNIGVLWDITKEDAHQLCVNNALELLGSIELKTKEKIRAIAKKEKNFSIAQDIYKKIYA